MRRSLAVVLAASSLVLFAPTLEARTVEGRHWTGHFGLSAPFVATEVDGVHDASRPYPQGPIDPSEVGRPFTFTIGKMVDPSVGPLCHTTVECRPSEVHMWNSRGGAYHVFDTRTSFSGIVPADVDQWFVRAGTSVYSEWALTFG